jgi:hypothetical protein
LVIKTLIPYKKNYITLLLKLLDKNRSVLLI